MKILQNRFLESNTSEWLSILEASDVWCSQVLTYGEFLSHEGFGVLDITQHVITAKGRRIKTVSCPVHVDGMRYKSEKPAPKVGQHTKSIVDEFNL